MTAPAHAVAIAFLRRAGLVTAVLALIAGILGMHVMTATHATHTPATAAAVSTHHDPSPADHPGERHPGPPTAAQMPAAQDQAGARTVQCMDSNQCTDSNHCTSMQSMTAACTPSAKTGSLAAPLPGTGIIATHTDAATLNMTNALWSYLPGSPSPGELCISRT